MIIKAIYPGTFDPVTNGHIDLIRRAYRKFEDLTVAVTEKATHKDCIFSAEERADLIIRSLDDLKLPVKVEIFKGLLVHYARDRKAEIIIRGLRQLSDFEFEFAMALLNRRLDSNIETVFLMPNVNYTFLSSRLVREIAGLNGDISGLVHPIVEAEIMKKFKNV